MLELYIVKLLSSKILYLLIHIVGGVSAFINSTGIDSLFQPHEPVVAPCRSIGVPYQPKGSVGYGIDVEPDYHDSVKLSYFSARRIVEDVESTI